jgi:hypothetical protein
MGWLGRQLGYLRGAIRVHPASLQPQPLATPQPPQVVYRKDQVAEAPLPGRPDVTLRRTTIDEVIVQPNKES